MPAVLELQVGSGDVAKLVECLPSTHQGLSSNLLPYKLGKVVQVYNSST